MFSASAIMSGDLPEAQRHDRSHAQPPTSAAVPAAAGSAYAGSRPSGRGLRPSQGWALGSVPARLQRACCAPGEGGCAECHKEDQKRLQRSVLTGDAQPNEVPDSVHAALRTPGSSLDGPTLRFMEPMIGRDLSHVRVHTGNLAASSAAAVHAKAYTVGSDIVFGAGRFAPGTTNGRRLLAHELTHVAQQDGGLPPSRIALSPAVDPLEREAEETAEAAGQPGGAVAEAAGQRGRAVAGAGWPTTGAVLQRADEDTETSSGLAAPGEQLTQTQATVSADDGTAAGADGGTAAG